MKDEKYVLTPKALFLMALMDAHFIVNFNDRQAELAWKLFNDKMKKQGYVSRKN